MKLISAFVFATWIVQSLYYLYPKFQASSHLLWLYSTVCVGPGQKPQRPVFSQRGSISHLQIIPHRPEKFEGQLDFGTMGVRENRSILFTLLNDNPIEVCITVKFLNFRTPENFAVIYLKFKGRGKTLGYFVKKMQMEKQTVKTLIRLLL